MPKSTRKTYKPTAPSYWAEFVTTEPRLATVQLDIHGPTRLYHLLPFSPISTPRGSGIVIGTDAWGRLFVSLDDFHSTTLTESGIVMFKTNAEAGPTALAKVHCEPRLGHRGTPPPVDVISRVLVHPWCQKVPTFVGEGGETVERLQLSGRAACAAPGCESGKSPVSKHCSRCHLVSYCSRACQAAHWGAGHSVVCNKFKPDLKVARYMSPGKRWVMDMCDELDSYTDKARAKLKYHFMEGIVAGIPTRGGGGRTGQMRDAMGRAWDSWSVAQRRSALNMIANNFWMGISSSTGKSTFLSDLAEHIHRKDFNPLEDVRVQDLKGFLAALCSWPDNLYEQGATAMLGTFDAVIMRRENDPSTPQMKKMLERFDKWQTAYDGTMDWRQKGEWYVPDLLGDPERLSLERKLWLHLRSFCEAAGKCFSLAQSLGTGIGKLDGNIEDFPDDVMV